MKPISSHKELTQIKEELISVREVKRNELANRTGHITNPISIVGILAKPFFKNASKISIFLSVLRIVFALFKKKRH